MVSAQLSGCCIISGIIKGLHYVPTHRRPSPVAVRLDLSLYSPCWSEYGVNAG